MLFLIATCKLVNGSCSKKKIFDVNRKWVIGSLWKFHIFSATQILREINFLD